MQRKCVNLYAGEAPLCSPITKRTTLQSDTSEIRGTYAVIFCIAVLTSSLENLRRGFPGRWVSWGRRSIQPYPVFSRAAFQSS